jgi:hypothetical protein
MVTPQLRAMRWSSASALKLKATRYKHQTKHPVVAWVVKPLAFKLTPNPRGANQAVTCR